MIQPYKNGQYQYEVNIRINAPTSNVWRVLSDFSNVTWAPGVQESYSIGNKTIGVGSGRHCKLEGFGEIDETITQWSEGIGFVYDVTPLGPLHDFYSSWWLEKIDNNVCALNILISYDLRYGLFGRLLHKMIMRSKLEGSLSQVSKAVKTRAENRKNSKISASKTQPTYVINK